MAVKGFEATGRKQPRPGMHTTALSAVHVNADYLKDAKERLSPFG